jgi:hypothetical protein
MPLPSTTFRPLSTITGRGRRRRPSASWPEYDRIIKLLSLNPYVLAARPHGWRVYPFQAGTYLLYYREFESYWLVAGVFHALRDPDWILSQALIRETAE